jgi:hypothetical protein
MAEKKKLVPCGIFPVPTKLCKRTARSAFSPQEVMVHVPKIMTQTRVRHEHVEQTVEVPIPHTQDSADAVGWFRFHEAHMVVLL